MRKILLTVLALSALAFAYGPEHEAETDHSFQEGVKNPGYGVGISHATEEEFHKGKENPGYGAGATHAAEPTFDKDKKDKSKK